MKFKSKITWWFHILIWSYILFTVRILSMYITNSSKLVIIIFVFMLILLILIILPMYVSTYYVLEDSYIYIRCGLITNIKIDYINIISFKESNNPISSPALSMDRIKIQYSINYYNNFILISPDRKKKFINKLNKRIKEIR
ncbi:PH domain-containing protein [Clostridium arbusti]|uniref:PH domain-containing protein n=1 Tax=Clostridium arbusti TaxID=1137848 RepID=UPI000287D861|nr:PH domain-containing protein [Clostridium arbusti]